MLSDGQPLLCEKIAAEGQEIRIVSHDNDMKFELVRKLRRSDFPSVGTPVRVQEAAQLECPIFEDLADIDIASALGPLPTQSRT